MGILEGAMMKAETLVMGGVEFSLKAHAVCAHCTEFADFQVDAESTTLEKFGEAAEQHFRKAGWRCFEPNAPTACPTCVGRYREVKATELKVGDIIIAIIAKGTGRRFEIVKTMPGLGAGPYLTLRCEDGKECEHETALDSRSATYTVERDE